MFKVNHSAQMDPFIKIGHDVEDHTIKMLQTSDAFSYLTTSKRTNLLTSRMSWDFILQDMKFGLQSPCTNLAPNNIDVFMGYFGYVKRVLKKMAIFLEINLGNKKVFTNDIKSFRIFVNYVGQFNDVEMFNFIEDTGITLEAFELAGRANELASLVQLHNEIEEEMSRCLGSLEKIVDDLLCTTDRI